VAGIGIDTRRSECIGLLGTNGADKSTTFQMLTASALAHPRAA
jgi:ABC-type multidrug transport system ATPase subunit